MSKKVVPKAEIKCPDCEQMFRRATGLGAHRRAMHGIIGSSYTTVKARAAKLATKEIITELPQAVPLEQAVEISVVQTKRKYTRRHGYGLAKLEKSKEITRESSKEAREGYNDGISEITLAIALGRFQGLCASMAHEFNIPSKLFTSRLAALIYATQVR